MERVTGYAFIGVIGGVMGKGGNVPYCMIVRWAQRRALALDHRIQSFLV
jgi:hypothetical protein